MDAVNSAPLSIPVAVIGAGTMGAGIAAALVQAGCTDVRLMSRTEQSLITATQRISGPVTTTTSLAAAVEGCQVVIESVFEERDLKIDICRQIENNTSNDTIIGTNTSSVPLDQISAAVTRPGNFAGHHWFNPAEVVRLVEVVSAPETAQEIIAQLMAWTTAVAKRPVHVQLPVAGFVANRLQYALLREAYALVEAGVCTYRDVDEVVRSSIGARWAAIGPFETMDLAGLEVHAAVAARLFPELSNQTSTPAALKALVEDKALGTKNGRGIRGHYSLAAVTDLESRRDRIMTALSALTDLPELTKDSHD